MSNHTDDDLEFNDDFYDDSFNEDDYQEAPDPLDDPLGEDFIEPFEGDDLGADLEGLGDEEWEDSDFIESDEEGLGAEKKKRKFDLSFNTMMIGGAVILGVAVLLFQLTSKKPASVQDRFSSAINMQGATQGPILSDQKPEENSQVADVRLETDNSEITDPVTSLNQAEQNSADQGFLYEPEILDTPEASVVDVSNDILPNVLNDVEVNNVPRVPPEIIMMPEEVLITEEIRKPESDIVLEEAFVEAPQKIAVTDIMPSQDGNKSLTGNINELSEKLELIFGRLDQMEAQISTLRQSDEVDLKEVSTEVERLKATIKNLSTAAPAQVKPKVVKKAAPKKSSAKKQSSASQKVAPSWELRAAQPGKAWVSKKGSRDIEPVIVGDNLSGVGRIQSISYVSGKWIIQGTSGSIRQ